MLSNKRRQIETSSPPTPRSLSPSPPPVDRQDTLPVLWSPLTVQIDNITRDLETYRSMLGLLKYFAKNVLEPKLLPFWDRYGTFFEITSPNTNRLTVNIIVSEAEQFAAKLVFTAEPSTLRIQVLNLNSKWDAVREYQEYDLHSEMEFDKVEQAVDKFIIWARLEPPTHTVSSEQCFSSMVAALHSRVTELERLQLDS